MIHTLAYTLIFGKPLIMYAGLVTFVMLLFTATVGALNFKGIVIIPFRWHPRLAIITIILAIVHAFFGLSVFLIINFGRP